MATPRDPGAETQGVRFAEHTQDIAPTEAGDLHVVESLTGNDRERDDLNPEAEAELQQLKTTLRNNIQSARAQHHNFEPVSLPGSAPASRVPSGANTPSRRVLPVGSTDPSPYHSPKMAAVHSPPLTPAATRSKDGKASLGSIYQPRAAPEVMTPQRSASPHRSSNLVSSEAAAGVPAHPKQAPRFSIGPSADSGPGSMETSPAGTPAPGTPSLQPATVSKPQAPADSIEQRFRFGNRDPSQGFTNSGQATAQVPNITPASTLPRSAASGVSLTTFDDKRSSLFGGKKHGDDGNSEKSGGSKSNLKRFFKFGDHKHKDKEKKEEKRIPISDPKNDGTRTPPNGAAPVQQSVPFADDHGLQTKYGKFGKMLGSGAGGSVRLMKRTGDGTTFAVKQFRDRHAYESEREYNKKVTAEFCIGSTLHHGNVIETIDIIHEKGKWFEVMEYAPYDLFATVMTGKMGREEVTCATLQILSGVCYLHLMGLAHRDLKLDNVVVNEHGIMKLIDFGSAVVFRYPFENDVVLATGVVGSDPYLAPEVYDNQRYDPRPADIWSIAIIFCCMTLRRFPWKAPRTSDNSYRLFISPPDPDQDKQLDAHRKSLTPGTARGSVATISDGKRGSQSEPASRNPSNADDENGDDSKSHHHHHHHNSAQPKSEPVSREPTQTADAPTIKGPMRLLRLLPRETRHIVGRMLELDPRKRATMEDILADPWVQNALVCRQDEDGVMQRAPGHTHTLQPSNADK
nr:hypothetical protein B0A51_12662 [Rachicladosporium sp. CCFEE 5018]